MVEKQEIRDALEVYKRNTEHILGSEDELVKAIETCQMLADEVKDHTGRWLSKPHVYGAVYCSKCDYELRTNKTKYCPNCGAKMK